jgi:hypothetical protein
MSRRILTPLLLLGLVLPHPGRAEPITLLIAMTALGAATGGTKAAAPPHWTEQLPPQQAAMPVGLSADPAVQACLALADAHDAVAAYNLRKITAYASTRQTVSDDDTLRFGKAYQWCSERIPAYQWCSERIPAAVATGPTPGS